MFNRKSIYALNKKDPNAIVYTDPEQTSERRTLFRDKTRWDAYWTANF